MFIAGRGKPMLSGWFRMQQSMGLGELWQHIHRGGRPCFSYVVMEIVKDGYKTSFRKVESTHLVPRGFELSGRKESW